MFAQRRMDMQLERQWRSLGVGRGGIGVAGLAVAATCHPSEPGHDMRDTPCHILVLRWRGFLQTAQGNVGQQLC